MSLATALRACAAALFVASSAAQSIPEINGNAFVSPLNGQPVTDVTGVVTTRGPNGFWIQSPTPDDDPRTSEGIFVFGRDVPATVGDLIMLDGVASEFRTSTAYLPLGQITTPTNIRVISSGNVIEPIEIGADVSPPTEQYSSLDNGDVFGVPNAQSRIFTENPALEPTEYGLDFMESLLGMMVTIKAPTAVSRPNQFGDTWVVGDWTKTGQNSRGGMTMTDKDANPEAILIGDPLDGSDNPDDTVMGATLGDITGVVYQAFGFYRILPMTAIAVASNPEPALPGPTAFESTGVCSAITVGQYNVENLTPVSEHLPAVAAQIVNYMKTPDIIFVQEVQDNSGATNDGIVDGTATGAALSTAIAGISGVTYSYVEIAPVDGQDGGQPGGNIRVGYLYNPAVIALHEPNPGSSTDAVEVLPGPELSFNPGRIAPADPAWTNSRKPLVAQWDLVDSNSTFFTINVHFGSKGGSSSIQGDQRTPVNGGVDDRQAQAELTAALIADILAEDPEANVITAGDFNEFTFVQPMVTFAANSGLKDLDVAAGIPLLERYSYLFDMNTQELDHMYVSPRIAGLSPGYEHIHVNTWATFDGQVSDHDPAVASLNLCRSQPEPPVSSSSSSFMSSTSMSSSSSTMSTSVSTTSSASPSSSASSSSSSSSSATASSSASASASPSKTSPATSVSATSVKPTFTSSTSASASSVSGKYPVYGSHTYANSSIPSTKPTGKPEKPPVYDGPSFTTSIMPASASYGGHGKPPAYSAPSSVASYPVYGAPSVASSMTPSASPSAWPVKPGHGKPEKPGYGGSDKPSYGDSEEGLESHAHSEMGEHDKPEWSHGGPDKHYTGEPKSAGKSCKVVWKA